MADIALSPKTYQSLLSALKTQIRTAQIRAALAVNRELVLLYWGIGREILMRQQADGWGAGVIGRLANDLKSAFPAMKGLSARNLGYMKAFAAAWPEEPILQQAAAKLPWFHNCVLLDRVKHPKERAWYAHQAVQNGWSRNVLVLQIESGRYDRQGKAITNFQKTMPAAESDLARQLIKDPYNFDFLTLGEQAHERDLERGLLLHLRHFLLELGVGFAFVGSQVPFLVGGEEFQIDLLFYHLKLRSYVIIDLKMGNFKPEYAGKMNFYLSAAADLLRHPDDKPSLGIILCKSKNGVVAEYALRDLDKPLGIAEFRFPAELKGTLPTIEELEAELNSPSR